MTSNSGIHSTAQREFLKGEIASVYLGGTGIEGVDMQGVLMRNWTTPVCRVMSRIFGCSPPNPPQPISRSPFCRREP
jgi:hypothetical protein